MSTRLRKSQLHGSTDEYFGDVSVYNNVEINEAEINQHCEFWPMDTGYIRYWGRGHGIETERNISGVVDPATIVSTGTFRANYPLKSPGYLYSFEVNTFYELKLSDLSIKTITVGGATATQDTYGVVGPRQLAVLGQYNKLYLIDFETETSEIIYTFDNYASGNNRTWNHKLLQPIWINGKVYVYMFSVINTPLDAIKTWKFIYIYNITDDVLHFSNDESIATSAVYGSDFTLEQTIKYINSYHNQVILFSNYPRTNSHGKFYTDAKLEIYDFETNSLTSYISDYEVDFTLAAASYINSGNVIDPGSNNLTVTRFHYNNVEWLHTQIVFNLSSHAFSKYEYGYDHYWHPISAAQGNGKGVPYLNTALNIYENGGFVMHYFAYDYTGQIINTLFFEASKVAYDRVCDVFDDVEGRIWVIKEDEEKLKGYKISDSSSRTVDISSLGIGNGLDSFRLEIYDDFFYLWKSTTTPSLREGYIIKAGA